MAFADNLPVSESFGVFVGVAGFDWLADGQAVAPDKGCSKPFAVKIDGGEVWLRLD